jgi:hypothetical protein
MKALALLAARLVFLIHLAFLAFVLFGSLLLPHWPHLVWLHLPLVAWGVLVVLMSWDCPLTLLENRLLALAGKQTYAVGFIDYYFAARFFPRGMPRRVQAGLGVFLLVLNAGTYSWVLLQG